MTHQTQEYRESKRTPNRFLKNLGNRNWGYVIYRTVYKAESDTLFPKALAKLDTYVRAEIQSDLAKEPIFDHEPNRQIALRYQNTILEDKEKYNGATLDQIRGYFLEWIEQQGKELRHSAEFQVYLVVDEEVMNELPMFPNYLQRSHMSSRMSLSKWLTGHGMLKRVSTQIIRDG